MDKRKKWDREYPCGITMWPRPRTSSKTDLKKKTKTKNGRRSVWLEKMTMNKIWKLRHSWWDTNYSHVTTSLTSWFPNAWLHFTHSALVVSLKRQPHFCLEASFACCFLCLQDPWKAVSVKVKYGLLRDLSLPPFSDGL